MNQIIKVEIPILIRWKISKEEILNGFEEENFMRKSSEIEEYPDIEYGLCIAKINDKIGITLGFLMEESRTITASYKISIVPKNKHKIIEKKVFKDNQSSGMTLCKWEELFDPANNYFIDDYMYITVEGIFSFEDEQEICGIPKIQSPSNLGVETTDQKKSFCFSVSFLWYKVLSSELLWNRDDKDFDISIVDGKIVKVHKLIISAKSPVFDRMLESGLKETKESKVTIIDFDFETVEIAMKYFYGISITKFLNVQIGINLLLFSDKYIISDLKNSMEEYLFQQKSPINVCEIVNASILVNSIKLREECFDFMLDCMKESIFIKDLDILDKEFSLNLLKASFTCFRA